jgi:hypothetical protein
MSENWTVKPDGGGDYTDVQTADDAKDGDCTGRGIINFDLYDGTNDLGKWTIAGWSNQDASNHPEYVVSKAERHDGTTTSSGAWVDCDSGYGLTYYGPEADYAEVVGVRFDQTVSNAQAVTWQGVFIPTDNYAPEHTVLDSCLCVFPYYSVAAINFGINTTVNNAGNDVRNNTVYDTSGTNSVQIGINCSTYSIAPQCTAIGRVQNNTVDDCLENFKVTCSTCVWDKLTFENNVGTNGSTADMAENYGWPVVDAYNNASEDTSSDTWKWVPLAYQVFSGSTTQAHALGNFSGTYHDKFAMSFQVTSTDVIKRVVPFLAKVNTPGTITWRIETDSSGHPSGTLADANLTGTISEGDVGGGGWIVKTVGTPAGLSLSTTYWFVLSLASDPGSGEYYMWNGSSTNVYANGHFEYHPDGGSWTDFVSTEPVDAAFRIEYEADRDNLVSQTPGNLFISEGADHHLKASSNAVDAGKTIAGWDHDAEHDPADDWRPQWRGWDIGAFELEELTHTDHADIYFRGSSVAYETNKYITEAKATTLAGAVNDAMDGVSGLDFDNVSVLTSRNDDTAGS